MHHIRTACLVGIEARPVVVNAHVEPGLPSFSILGLGEAAMRETRVRVQAAISNCSFTFPTGRIVVELAVAPGVKLDGAGFDLPIALALLAATGQAELKGETFAFGELSLSGEVRPVRGACVLPSVASPDSPVLCAVENAHEAVLSSPLVVTVRTLTEAVRTVVTGEGSFVDKSHADRLADKRTAGMDMREIRGQKRAKRACEIAAAGGFNLALVGGPGTGRTMFARRIVGILPEMTETEAREVTAVHSVAGLNIGGSLIRTRPFRAPHHSTTAAGLYGGGFAVPRPGELTLAHRGVLMIDDAAEFAKQAVELLTATAKMRKVDLMRSTGTVHYPADCMIVATAQPCPCGRRHNGPMRCRCDAESIARYTARARRVTDACEVGCIVEAIEMASLDREYNADVDGPDTATMRARVIAARERQTARGQLNRDLPGSNLDKVARTIADLDGADVVTDEHKREAATFTDSPIY